MASGVASSHAPCMHACNGDVQKSSGNDKFLIDGFPRNQENLDGWNK